MRRLTYENSRGENIVFYLSPLVINSLTGIGEVEATLQSRSAPYQDGDNYIDTLLEPRYIDMEATITRTNLKEIKEYRSYINRVCNPKLGIGKIILELDGDTKEIEAVLDGTPTFPERGQEVWQQFSVSWKCPDPYWRDIQETSRALQAYVGTFTMPFSFPVQFGTQGDSIIIENEGDTSAPVQVSMQGPLDRPMLENRTTGEYMRLNTNIHTDEILFIDTTFNNKRVEIYHGNQIIKAMGYFDHNGDFMQLVPGENELRYTAYSGVRDSVASITWANRYVGI